MILSEAITTNPMLWLAVIFMPVLIALGYSLSALRKRMDRYAPLAALPALLTALFLPAGSGARISWLFFESVFVMDQTAKVFLLFTALLWMVAGIYSTTYIDKAKGRIRYFICFLLSMAGNFGLILAQDTFSFYFLFALMSFASYGLVVHDQSQESFRAGKVYLILVVLGEAFIFSALLSLAHLSGSFYINEMFPSALDPEQYRRIGWLLFIGFGIKAGALPLHVWLPLAHPVAPTPASAVLSGSMIKAGLLGWLRFLPLGVFAMPDLGWSMIVFGMIAAVYGALVGLTQSKTKAVLAYSSISQMGLMTLVVGVGLAVPKLWEQCWLVLMIFCVHHALAKGALFLSVGTAQMNVKFVVGKLIRDIGVIWPALAIIGIPFTSGELAKGSVKYVLKKGYAYLPEMDVISLLVLFSSVTTALVMSRFIWLIFNEQTQSVKIKGVNKTQMISWGALVLMVMMFPFIVGQWAMFAALTSKVAVSPKNMWSLAVGVGIYGVLYCLRFFQFIKIPAGDILGIYSNSIKCVLTLCQGFSSWAEGWTQKIRSKTFHTATVLTQSSKRIHWLEDAFSSWRIFGVAFLVLSTAIMLLMIR